MKEDYKEIMSGSLVEASLFLLELSSPVCAIGRHMCHIINKYESYKGEIGSGFHTEQLIKVRKNPVYS